MTTRAGPLDGVKVIDLATVIAGPGAARHMGDFGAEVVKIEPPTGDSARNLGWRAADGESYYWKLLNRNKTVQTLDLTSVEGRSALLSLVDDAHVLIENMRPGKLEALGLGPDVLHGRNPEIVICRVTAFGQDGPYAGRPGFATIAEGMSGFAAISGHADGPPLLPPVALTDELTSIAAAYAIMTALWHARETGEGQVVDVNLIETMTQMLGPLPSVSAHLGYEQPRLDGGLPYSSPRGTYRSRDGRWLALSASSDSIAARLMELIGDGADERFASFDGRAAHRDEVEARMTSWIGVRDAETALRELSAADVAVTPVYSVGGLRSDSHAIERRLFVEVEGVVQQRPLARLSVTPTTPGRLPRSTRSDE